MKQQLIFTNHPISALDEVVNYLKPASTFIVTDDNVDKAVIEPLLTDSKLLASSEKIVCRSGDVNKNLDSLAAIWMALSRGGASRKSVVINIGGGMITDMGAFAAATFKRGVAFVNVPTTLLAAVDASVGAKTGINFNGLKNEVGVFAPACASIISAIFFDTLPDSEILSGYAEMMKHSLLQDRKHFAELLNFDPVSRPIDHGRLLNLLQQSVAVKKYIVDIDPYEHNMRKALNFGHTVGHAFESYAMHRNKPVPHGYAVAWGMIVELVLSHMKLKFPSELLNNYVARVRENYGAFHIDCDDYPALVELMQHDKKNYAPGEINFTLLRAPGDIVTDCVADRKEISAALDIYRDLLGI